MRENVDFGLRFGTLMAIGAIVAAAWSGEIGYRRGLKDAPPRLVIDGQGNDVTIDGCSTFGVLGISGMNPNGCTITIKRRRIAAVDFPVGLLGGVPPKTCPKKPDGGDDYKGCPATAPKS